MSGWKTTTASLGAMVTSLLTLGCCLPLPFLGAAGLAGASVVLSAARPWLLGLSVILLGGGFFQVYRGMKCRARQSRIALVLLGLAAGVIVFPVFLSPGTGRIAGGHSQPAKSSSRAAVSFHSHARELRPTAYRIQSSVR